MTMESRIHACWLNAFLGISAQSGGSIPVVGYRKCQPSLEDALIEHDWLVGRFVIVGLIGALLCMLAAAAIALLLTNALANITNALANMFTLSVAPPASAQSGESLVDLLILLAILSPLGVIVQILGAIGEGSAFILEHLQSLPLAAQLICDSIVRLWP